MTLSIEFYLKTTQKLIFFSNKNRKNKVIWNITKIIEKLFPKVPIELEKKKNLEIKNIKKKSLKK